MVAWLVGMLLVLGANPAAVQVGGEQPPNEFAAIDAHALAAPAQAADSISSLAAYLTVPASGEKEKARAIFRWITANIAYDSCAATYSRDPQAVLRQRRGVCMGYARLFEALAEAAGLEAQTIVGHSRKARPGADEEAPSWLNHSWNAVLVEGEWKLLDCCWGAGYLDEDNRFIPDFNPHYFLTAPDAFVYDHFPQDPRWQLLHSPLSRNEYLQRVQVGPPFFACGLRLVSHRSAEIEAKESLAVTIGAPAQTSLLAALYRGDQPVPGDYTFTQRGPRGFVVQVRFPGAGDYVLRVFARRADAPGTEYAWALDYRLRAHSAQEGGPEFPRLYSSFVTRNCRLDRGLQGTLAAGDAADLALTVPGAQEVVVATTAGLIPLAGDGLRFAGTVQVTPGPVIVFARFPGQAAYEGLLEYTGQPDGNQQGAS